MIYVTKICNELLQELEKIRLKREGEPLETENGNSEILKLIDTLDILMKALQVNLSFLKDFLLLYFFLIRIF